MLAGILSKNALSIASNTIYQIIGKASTTLVTIITVVVVSRTFGTEGYGEFSLMQNWPALFFIIVDFGINAIAARELSKDFSKAGKYVGNIIVLRVIMSFVFIGALYLALGFFPYSNLLRFGIGLSSLLLVTYAFITSMNIVFQVKLRYDLSVKALLGGYVLILILVLLFSYLKFPVWSIGSVYVLGGIVTAILAYHYLRKLGVRPQFVFDSTLSKFLLLQTLPIGITFVFSQINFKADEILLSILNLPASLGLNNLESVALYSLPYKIFEVTLVVPTFFMNSAYPVMVRDMLVGKQQLKRTFIKSGLVLAVLAVIVSLVGIALAPLAIKILGGSEFFYSITVLRILLGGLIFYSLTQPLAWLLVTLEKQKYLPPIYISAAAVNLFLNIIFIPKHSFYASAIITHICEALILIMLSFATARAWKLKYV